MDMKLLSHLRELEQQGVHILQEAHGLKHYELPNLFTPGIKRQLLAIAAFLFGPTKFTSKQREAVSAASRNGHNLATLVMIHKHAKKAASPGGMWQIWVTLTAMSAGYSDIDSRGKELAATYAPVVDRKEKVTVHARKDDNNADMHVVLDSADMDDLTAAIDALIDPESDLPIDQQRAIAFKELLRSGIGIGPAPVAINVIVKLPDYTKILGGQGDDIVLATDTGTTMTGKQFLERTLNSDIFIGLFHPVVGPANLYRFARCASKKQKHLLGLETPVCAAPNCSVPASRCQPHHIESWVEGGETNLENMTLLCPFHNGRNDDRPGEYINGRIVRINGQVMHTPPWPHGTPRQNNHPIAKLGAMRNL